MAPSSHWVGFDLGGTKMLAQIYDENFRVLGRKRRKTRGHEGSEVGVDRIVKTIQEALEDAGLKSADISGIGVGCPAPVDLTTGHVLEAVNLGWENVPLQQQLEEAFGCPAAVLNDVDAGVYAEYRFGAARGAHCVLGVFPGTGIGGGLVYEGEIFRGSRSSCIEIGHMQVRPNGNLCGCGRQGCLETEAGRLAIAAEAAKAAYRGEAPYLMERCGTNLTEIRSDPLAKSVANGDTAVEHIVRRAAAMIGVAVGSVVNLLVPDVVVLGGGMVEAMPDLFVGEVAESARNRAMTPFADTFRVVAAELADDASVQGAAAWIEAHHGS